MGEGPPVPNRTLGDLAALANEALEGSGSCRVMSQVTVRYTDATLILRAAHCVELHGGRYAQIVTPIMLDETVAFLMLGFEDASGSGLLHPEANLPWLKRCPVEVNGRGGLEIISHTEVGSDFQLLSMPTRTQPTILTGQ